ncbi:Macrophage mannose receptor 1 [Armadillidium nasatum]|uniref:Macrophage mannose receptor 1 n=1 Tax=Armadillidium nasatum TaxID=96803 RepID=A0A5N5SY16_9CRUS|nr:Macrophage mannose receptor 1 [Armadillidium nasatum]
MVGRYVFIKMGVPGNLSLCEVEVFSKHDISRDRCRGDFDVSKLGLYNRTCYEFQVTSGGTFDVARNYCQKRRNGDLVQFIEPLTQSFLSTELQRIDSEVELQIKMLWIGLQKEPQFTSRVWRWLDGTKVDNPTWGKDQPNNYNQQQNCVVLDGNINCGEPSKINNGVVSLPDGRTTYDAKAQYVCAENYTMDGNETVICGDSGSWEPRIPQCLCKHFT